jgi:5-methylthioadenosine/S-adenosylhomocysteine deaminase
MIVAIGCQSPPPEPPSSGTDLEAPDAGELLIHNGTVLTFDDSDTVIGGGALLIADGRIESIGPQEELLEAFPTVQRIDAKGGVILPGLINAHTHVPMTILRGVADDLELMEWLQKHIFPAEAQLVNEEFVRWGTRLACLEMLRGGITTFVDMYYYEDVIAEEAERCGMRAVVGETLIDFPAPDNKTWEQAVSYTRSFAERWRGHPRITPAVAPHAPYTVSADHLIEAHELATELDVPLLIHLAEDRAEVEQIKERTGKTPVEYANDLGILTSRVLAAHMVWPSETDIEILAAKDIGIAHCPQSNMKVAAGVAPVPAMIDAGVAVGIGTDGPASNNDLNLWEEIDTAAKLHKVTALDPTVIPARTALRMATVEGARALGMASEIGSLEAGKRADLIIVGTGGYHQQPHFNPYSLLTYSTKASDVDTVIIEGRLVLHEGRVLTLDDREILDKAREYRNRILELEK